MIESARAFASAGLLALAVAFVPGLHATADELAARPVVVLVGDGVTRGYAPAVVERLKGLAEVVVVAGEGGADVLEHLEERVIRRGPAVVHFGVGADGSKAEAYRANLAEIVRRLDKETAARLIFATATPVADPRREAEVEACNEAAREVVRGSSIVAVDDLHALVRRMGVAASLGGDGVGLKAEASRAVAGQVARAVLNAIDGPPVTRVVACRWASVAPKVDGKLDDPVWEAAAVVDRFPAFWANAENRDGTRARLLWDEEALYFAATMTDAELRSAGTKRNDALWFGDVFELFFKPSEGRPEYYEFQVNPESVLLEYPFVRRGEDLATVAARPTLGFRAVARADGTVNRAGDVDRGWTVEGRIPWSGFGATGGRPKVGEAWKFALCRYDYGPEGTEPVLMSSAPLRRPSFHRYEDYGTLRFEGKPR